MACSSVLEQTFTFPSGWLLITLMIPRLLILYHYQVQYFGLDQIPAWLMAITSAPAALWMVCYLLLCVSMHAKHSGMLTFAFLLKTPLSKGLTELLVWDRRLISGSYAWLVLFLKKKSVLFLDRCDSQQYQQQSWLYTGDYFPFGVPFNHDNQKQWAILSTVLWTNDRPWPRDHLITYWCRSSSWVANQHCIQTILWTKKLKL